MERFTDALSRFFSNGATLALIGVIVGGLITGYFSYQTQQSIIDAQHRQFTSNYLLEKNNILKKDVASFSDCLALIMGGNNSKIEVDSIIASMLSISLRIILTEDFNIGSKCWDLTTSIKEASENGKFNEVNFKNKVFEWVLAVKAEMKIVDYSIDENALERDLQQLILQKFGEEPCGP